MNTILVPIDFSDVTDRVVDQACAMAKALGSKLVLLHISEPDPDFVGFEPGPLVVRTAVARDFKAEHQRLDELKAKAGSSGLEVAAIHLQGPLVEKILNHATEHGADMIVMGSHGHGSFYELLVGSVTSGVLRDARCPVLVVPAKETKKA
jgi:nucleotide-binding universal stress UspA family protein